jgi:hypothetical protein
MSKSNLVVLNVLQTTNSGDRGDGNLPSQFFAGAGAGHGRFQVERGSHGLRTTSISNMKAWLSRYEVLSEGQAISGLVFLTLLVESNRHG